MQKAEVILSLLSEKAKKDENYVFQRLYRNLFNYDLYLLAYNNIHSREGNMTAGIDERTIDGFNTELIHNIIEKMKNETYHPKPVLRKYIPKKNGKLRPLGIPAFQDKLVQEVVRLILQAIYEPMFFISSHGFRPGKSCHTALHQIKSTCRGTNWVIEGDIKGFFDNIDHDILLNLLTKKINDGRFIELIKRFLKAGYFEFKQVKQSLSGTPQGGIISPILANIYLHELDKFMDEIVNKYSTSSQRKKSKEYMKLYGRRSRAKAKGDIAKANENLNLMKSIPVLDPMDPDYIRVKYVRYADDFVVCIIGSKSLATEIREKIKVFLAEHLKLELNLEKTLITNLGDSRVRFLGYEIAKSNDNSIQTKNSMGIKKRSVNGTIQLLVPGDVINNKLKPFVRNGKSVHHNARINLPVLDIINQYNAEIRGLYNYYSLATDVSTKIGKFKFYHYYSLAKTLARKDKSTVAKVIKKYGIDVKRKDGFGTRKVIGATYTNKNGEIKTLTYFNESLKKADTPLTHEVDNPKLIIPSRHQLIDRLNKGECELCGFKDNDIKKFEVHHVRKLKDIKNKYAKRGKSIPKWVLTMSSMNRKTLIVCKDCHTKIHNGENNKPFNG